MLKYLFTCCLLAAGSALPLNPGLSLPTKFHNMTV